MLVLVTGLCVAALTADAEVPGAARIEVPARVESAEIEAARTKSVPVLSRSAEELARRFGVGRKLAAIIYHEARTAGIEPAMAFGVIAQESGFDPLAVGRSGERGLMQIKPSTARAYDARVTADALMKPETNLRLGLRHLKREVEYFGDPILGLMSYHMGRARLQRELADGLAPRDRYVERVLSSCGADCA